jgi:lytic murein transglycosylase
MGAMRPSSGKLLIGALLAALQVASAGLAHAQAACRASGAGFDRWLESFKQEAVAAGISRQTLAAVAPLLDYDVNVISRDRGQRVFSQTFLEFSGRMVAKYRLDMGAKRIKQYASMFSRIEQQFGVPPEPIVAFWGLETDFGANIGNLPTLRALATLAFDCRRPQLFRPQLIAALKIVERGDLTPDQMIGPFAGELGQLQFLPSHYFDYGVDYDGDGRRDLLRSAPDALASAANYMKNHGWRRGEPWLQEVRVPAKLPWDQADLSIQHPRAQWARWGVSYPGGRTLPADNLPASLLLPMGRFGPAFLAYPNFQVFLEWNQSLVYATTAAYFATRLAGAPAISRGAGEVAPFGYPEMRELQTILARQGFKIGPVDGKLGLQTRAAIKQAQMRLGLPADSYPTPELLQRLRGAQ